MKVAEYIARFLKEKEIDTIFLLQGGMITRLVDAIHKQEGVKIVSVHHEQSAAFSADAYARVKNKPGIAMATSGPGATNLITGIGSCYFDSVPAIFITGQVNIGEQKGDNPTRQIGFQETDIVSVIRPLTKAAYKIRTSEEITSVLESAYRISMGGRPGPVLIDIPMDIQDKIVPDPSHKIDTEVSHTPDYSITEEFLSKFQQALMNSKKPLCLAGRGILAAKAQDMFIDFIERYNLPVVTSLLGVDSIPHDHPNRVGFIGTYGNRWANYALGGCDTLIVLGSRLDLRQTGADVDSFKQNKAIFHIDIDNAELNNRVKGCTTLEIGLQDFFMQECKSKRSFKRNEDWFEEISAKRFLWPDTGELKNIKGINPNSFVHSLSKASLPAKVITTDVGNNQMWAAQSLEIQPYQRFLSSGGMGSMGYSLPAAIGAAFAEKNAPVLCISGDGGFLVNIQELQTIRRNNLPVKMVILNNHSLGMIRQFQDAYFDSCYQSTVWGYDTPDFKKISEAFGIEAYSIDEPSEIDKGLSCLWADPNVPYLLNVNIDLHTNVFPKMMFGNPITVMEPIID